MSILFIISWHPIQKQLPRKEESVMIILIPIGISYVVELKRKWFNSKNIIVQWSFQHQFDVYNTILDNVQAKYYNIKIFLVSHCFAQPIFRFLLFMGTPTQLQKANKMENIFQYYEFWKKNSRFQRLNRKRFHI